MDRGAGRAAVKRAAATVRRKFPLASAAPRGDRRGRAPSFSSEEAIALLVQRGVAEEAVRLGSIPETSMRRVRRTVQRSCPRRPLRALHVGNFVGVSLAALSDVVVSHDPGSVVVSIDPNLPHLGVEDPQGHVLTLLDHFGLQESNVVICGYSLHRSPNETRAGSFADQPAGEGTLLSLERLGQRFDLALIDGNHDADYVRSELDVLVRLLSDNGLLILDDVFNEHTDLPELFEGLVTGERWPLEELARDERLGILRRTERKQDETDP